MYKTWSKGRWWVSMYVNKAIVVQLGFHVIYNKYDGVQVTVEVPFVTFDFGRWNSASGVEVDELL